MSEFTYCPGSIRDQKNTQNLNGAKKLELVAAENIIQCTIKSQSRLIIHITDCSEIDSY